jgi:hypothetical protein
MSLVGVYGERLGQPLHLTHAPSLITRSLRSAELAVTETADDNPVPGLSGSLPAEDAYLVSLKFRDYPDCECWERGRSVIKTDVRAGATYLYDLKRDPRYCDRQAVSFHLFLFAALGARRHRQADRRATHRRTRLSAGVGHDDAVIRHLGARFWRRCVGRTKPTSFSSII